MDLKPRKCAEGKAEQTDLILLVSEYKHTLKHTLVLKVQSKSQAYEPPENRK